MAIEVNTVDWAMLLPHAARGALFLIEAGTDLEQVAQAIADDEAPRVQHWLQTEAMRKPTDDELGEDAATLFAFAIVQPFVVAQRVQS